MAGELNPETIGIRNFLQSLYAFLDTKNRRYGNSVNRPVRIFSRHAKTFVPGQDIENRSLTLIRIDDKLSRIAYAPPQELRKNDVVDLIGYLVILADQSGWHDLKDLLE